VNVIGIAMLAVGFAALGIGAWSAVTARRPAWLSTKTIRPDSVRIWGAGTAIAGLGVAIFGIDELLLSHGGLSLAAFILIFGGAGMVAVATPRTRRPR
jgi:hypothetical protein